MSKIGRQYVVTGEAEPGVWNAAEEFLGQLGLNMHPVKSRALVESDAALPSKPELVLPYHLPDIDTRDHYVVLEHLMELWPDYYKLPHPKTYYQSRRIAVEDSFEAVIRCQPKRIGKWALRDVPSDLSAKAGLKVVPRLEAGFPKMISELGCQRNKVAVQAGGLIDFIVGYEDLPEEERLVGLHLPGVAFLKAFTGHLSHQIEQAA